jgi:peptidoglycan/LPS O-acetylase OafA/YrhL
MCAALLMLTPAMFLNRGNPIMFTIGFPLLTFGYGAILMLVVSGMLEPIEEAAVMRGMAGLGRISYNVYLWHYFLPDLIPQIYSPIQLWISQVIPWAFGSYVAQFIVFAAFSTVAGYIGTKMIETPFLRLRERMIPSKQVAV